MVDAADPARLPEAAEELKRVLADNQLISGVPIAVLANKVDAQVSDIISSIFSIIPLEHLKGHWGSNSDGSMNERIFRVFISDFYPKILSYCHSIDNPRATL